MCRAQVRSEAHPELDGAWFRAFDYEKWDYWGSSADVGWAGWMGPSLDATVDLGEPRDVAQAGGEFLRAAASGIFLPSELRVSTSLDGETFEPAGSLRLDPPVEGDLTIEKRLLLIPIARPARYLRVEATPLGPIPSWLPHAAGLPSWLFADELVIR